MEGCFFWGWLVACELQIFLFLPFLIWGLYNVNNKVKTVILAIGFMAGVALNCYLVDVGEYTAGILSPYNFWVYSGFFNKPYTKIYAVFLGVGLGFLFDAKSRASELTLQKIEAKSYRNWLIVILMWALGLFMLTYGATRNYHANLIPFIFTHMDNVLYIGLGRPLFCLGLIVLYLPLFFGYGNTMKTFLSSPGLRVISKMGYSCYFIAPVVMLMYMAQLN